jgi:hypothetical protein
MNVFLIIENFKFFLILENFKFFRSLLINEGLLANLEAIKAFNFFMMGTKSLKAIVIMLSSNRLITNIIFQIVIVEILLLQVRSVFFNVFYWYALFFFSFSLSHKFIIFFNKIVGKLSYLLFFLCWRNCFFI